MRGSVEKEAVAKVVAEEIRRQSFLGKDGHRIFHFESYGLEIEFNQGSNKLSVIRKAECFELDNDAAGWEKLIKAFPDHAEQLEIFQLSVKYLR